MTSLKLSSANLNFQIKYRPIKPPNLTDPNSRFSYFKNFWGGKYTEMTNLPCVRTPAALALQIVEIRLQRAKVGGKFSKNSKLKIVNSFC